MVINHTTYGIITAAFSAKEIDAQDWLFWHQHTKNLTLNQTGHWYSIAISLTSGITFLSNVSGK